MWIVQLSCTIIPDQRRNLLGGGWESNESIMTKKLGDQKWKIMLLKLQLEDAEIKLRELVSRISWHLTNMKITLKMKKVL